MHSFPRVDPGDVSGQSIFCWLDFPPPSMKRPIMLQLEHLWPVSVKKLNWRLLKEKQLEVLTKWDTHDLRVSTQRVTIVWFFFNSSKYIFNIVLMYRVFWILRIAYIYERQYVTTNSNTVTFWICILANQSNILHLCSCIAHIAYKTK